MLHLWPIALTFVGEAYVSIQRIQSFLLLPEGKYQKVLTMHYNDEDEEAQNLMGNGSKSSAAALGTYGTIHGKDSKKKRKSVLFKDLQLTQSLLYKRRTHNVNAAKKGIVFDNVTAMWISDENGQNIGK